MTKRPENDDELCARNWLRQQGHAVAADPGYAGVLAHNPASIYRSPYKTTWGRETPYALDQLACVIPFNWEPPSVRQTGVGRNVDLFEAGIRWAGQAANSALPLLPALMVVNQDFEHPLPLSEVQATARSIEKYRKRWAARGWHCPRWIARQAARSAKQTGKARKRSVSPEGSNEARRPWDAEGVSRATWYRRRKVGRETVPNTDKPCPVRGRACEDPAGLPRYQCRRNAPRPAPKSASRNVAAGQG